MGFSFGSRVRTLLQPFAVGSPMGRYGSIDDTRYAKCTFLAGVAAFAVGAVMPLTE